MRNGLYKKPYYFLLLISLLIVIRAPCQDRFPVPPGSPNQLFYLQRSTNANTIVCELNYKDGIVDANEPIHVYWIRYDEQGQKTELSFVQRKFAYGVKSRLISKDKYEVNFVSYKKFPMVLMKGNNNKYSVYAIINQKQAIVNRIFVKINGGSFWSPNVEYIEVKGIDPVSGKEVVERRKI